MRRRPVALVAAALAAAPGAASADIQIGHTGWAWGNPTPQGHALEAVAFAGQRGVAVGEFGTILRTEDGGVTWTAVASDTRQLLTDVVMPDASTVIAGGSCALRRSDDGGRTFRRVAFRPSERQCSPDTIEALAFPTPQSGYVFLRSGRVLRTDNGGRTFTRREAVPGPFTGQRKITEVSFADLDTGIAGLNGFDPNFFRTADAAATWSKVAVTPAPPISLLWQVNGLQFVGPQTVYASGNESFAPHMIKSVDAGQTWAPLPLTGGDAEAMSLHCADAMRCVMLAVDNTASHAVRGALIITADGGQTARLVKPLDADPRTAYVTDSGAILELGAGGLTLRSPDFGQTFARIGSAAPGPFDHLRRGAGDSIYAFGDQGALARSSDGGRGFIDLDGPLGARPVDLSFAGTTGYVLVGGGRLLSTVDGGDSWSVLAGQPARARAIQALSAQTVLAATARGILRSTDGGQSFAATRGAHGALVGFDRTGGALIAYGPHALISSRDGGASWRALRLPSRYDLETVDFTDPRHGWATDENWRLWHTRDGGRSWAPALASGGDDVVAVSFFDARHGFATAADDRIGDVLRTSDGGRTWRPQWLRTGQDVDEVLALGPDSGVALPEGTNQVYVTRTGGDAGAPSRLTIGARRRGGRVIVGGRLRPAAGGEQVSVALRGRRYWSVKRVRVGRDGRFATSWKPRRGLVFVAQWEGRQGVQGDGTPPLRVRLGRHKRR